LLHAAFGFWVMLNGMARGDSIDLSRYRLTFVDDFSHPNITAHGPGAPWITHTPWNGDFGNDVFDDPGPNGTFDFSPTGLTITAHKDATGLWHGGLICSVDRDGAGQQGFSQQYGYFEMTARLPDGPGVWPAFWLIGVQKQSGVSEIDIMEYYGHARNEYHITEHYWVDGKDTLGSWHVVTVPAGSLTDQDNKFGVLITAQETIYYLNDVEVWRAPTPPEYRQKMYILANLAIGGGWPYDALASPQMMQIRSIKAYEPAP
jgi:hypothetical protein